MRKQVVGSICAFLSFGGFFSDGFGQSVSHEVVAFTGDAAPSTGGGTIQSLSAATVAPNGRAVFTAGLAGGPVNTTNNSGIFSAAPGTLPDAVVARKGQTGPGGFVFETLSSPFANDSAQYFFVAGNSAYDSSLRTINGSAGLLLTGVFQEFPAPGDSLNRKFLLPIPTGIAASGEFLLDAALYTGTNKITITGRGVWKGVSGNVNKIAVTGEAAPGLAATTFTQVAASSMSSNGVVVFFGGLSGDSSGNESFWKSKNGVLTLLIRKGSTVLDGESITGLDSVAINDSEVVAFSAESNVSGEGLWRRSGATLERLLKEGDPAPGTNPARTFGTFVDVSINNAGQIVFESDLNGEFATNRSIWRLDPDGAVHRIAQLGSALPTPTGTGVVTSLVLSRPSLASDGTVVFAASFGSQNGVYRASVSANPAQNPAPNPTPSKAPVVVPKGGKVLRTQKPSAMIRGTISSTAPIRRVEYRVGNSKRFKAAKGTSKWSFRIVVPVGSTTVAIRAISSDGQVSQLVSRRIVRSTVRGQ